MKKNCMKPKSNFTWWIIFYYDVLMFNVQECIWHGQSMIEKWQIIS